MTPPATLTRGTTSRPRALLRGADPVEIPAFGAADIAWRSLRALVAFLLLVVMPGAPSGFLFLVVRHLLLEAMHLFLVAFLLLVVMPGAPSGFLFLIVRHLLLEAMHLFLVAFLVLVVRPGGARS